MVLGRSGGKDSPLAGSGTCLIQYPNLFLAEAQAHTLGEALYLLH